jgi:hypothetical protein
MPFRPFNDLVDDARRATTEIDCDELAELLDRDIAKVAFGGAVAEHQLACPIIPCGAGSSCSALAAVSLRALGFTNVKSLARGLGASGQSGRPVEHRRSP